MSKEKIKPINEEDLEDVESTDDLEALIKKNIQWSQVIYNQNKKIKNRLTLMTIGNYARLAILIIPLIIGIIYLPPLMQELWQAYGQILGVGGDIGSLTDLVEQFSN